MARLLWCWRCQMEVPMLDEAEWQQVEPLFRQAVDDLKRYRQQHQCGIEVASAMLAGLGSTALAAYEQLTGFRETNYNALFHHRISLYGRPCAACGKPLRTPQARYCAECGAAWAHQAPP